jgi:hypothetical protein
MPLEMVVRQDVINRNRGFRFRSERTPDRTKQPRLKPGLLEGQDLYAFAAHCNHERAACSVMVYGQRSLDCARGGRPEVCQDLAAGIRSHLVEDAITGVHGVVAARHNTGDACGHLPQDQHRAANTVGETHQLNGDGRIIRSGLGRRCLGLRLFSAMTRYTQRDEPWELLLKRISHGVA